MMSARLSEVHKQLYDFNVELDCTISDYDNIKKQIVNTMQKESRDQLKVTKKHKKMKKRMLNSQITCLTNEHKALQHEMGVDKDVESSSSDSSNESDYS